MDELIGAAQAECGGSVAATWLCGERTLMSQACWPTMLASQGQSQTNNRHGLISAMREKSAVRRVFARTLPGEMLVCVCDEEDNCKEEFFGHLTLPIWGCSRAAQ